MKDFHDKHLVGRWVHLIRCSFTELSKNDPLRMAGATAFFTTFALPPILLMIIQALGLIYEPRTIGRQLFQNLREIIGPEGVRQIINTLIAFRDLAQNWWITIGGFIFLVFVATTLFKVIKSSLNQVWKVRAFGKRRLKDVIRSRSYAILVIMLAGVLFAIGLALEGAQAFLGKYISGFSPALALYFNNTLSYLLTLAIVTVWFALLFRYLPDARAPWRTVLTGGFVTSLLFNSGKVVLHWLLTYSNLNTIFGTSASIVLILLFVFYSSLILYFGAAFTKIWAEHYGDPIRPAGHAVHYRVVEEEER